MASSDLPTLRDQLPEVFEDMDPPHDWDDYHVIPTGRGKDDNFEIGSLTEAERLEEDQALLRTEDPTPTRAFGEGEFSGVENTSVFPGSPQGWSEGKVPPPDTLAFYLPFHFYYPDLWGIYLTKEGVGSLMRYLQAQSGFNWGEHDWTLSQQEAEVAARLFLYYHEAFHHNVESMASRLEVTHRQPLYRRGFLKLYRRTFLTSECTEEALANAYAFKKVSQVFKKKGWNADAVRSGLRQYIKGQPPGYNRGMEFVEDDAFVEKRNEFGEANLRESLPFVKKDGALWNLFTYAFSGICKLNKHTNYLVRKDSSFMDSDDLNEYHIGYGDLKDKLDGLVGLHFKRQGNGSHEIYETDAGDTVTLYYTTGDVPKGTLNSILKQAGVDMNVHEFIRARV